MTHSFELSHEAKSDLEDIWLYTYDMWSKSQANTYYNSLIAEIHNICRSPRIGKSIDELDTVYRIHPCLSHLIVYRTTEDKIYVVRILHKRMDIETRL